MDNLEKDSFSKILTPTFIVGFSLYLLRDFFNDTVEVFYWIILRKKGYSRRGWKKYKKEILGRTEKERIWGLLSISRGERDEGFLKESEETDSLLSEEIMTRDGHYEQR